MLYPRSAAALRKAYEGSYGIARARVGTAFGKFLAKILPNAENQFAILNGERIGACVSGCTVVDSLWQDIVFEFKTSGGALKRRQAQQLALYAAKQTTQTLTYIFLRKPSVAEVARLATWVQEAAPEVRLAIGYLYEF